ncbi:unnamed protein product, partial [Amoebophrya sp. A25]
APAASSGDDLGRYFRSTAVVATASATTAAGSRSGGSGSSNPTSKIPVQQEHTHRIVRLTTMSNSEDSSYDASGEEEGMGAVRDSGKTRRAFLDAERARAGRSSSWRNGLGLPAPESDSEASLGAEGDDQSDEEDLQATDQVTARDAGLQNASEEEVAEAKVQRTRSTPTSRRIKRTRHRLEEGGASDTGDDSTRAALAHASSSTLSQPAGLFHDSKLTRYSPTPARRDGTSARKITQKQDSSSTGASPSPDYFEDDPQSTVKQHADFLSTQRQAARRRHRLDGDPDHGSIEFPAEKVPRISDGSALFDSGSPALVPSSGVENLHFEVERVQAATAAQPEEQNAGFSTSENVPNKKRHVKAAYEKDLGDLVETIGELSLKASEDGDGAFYNPVDSKVPRRSMEEDVG